jgi:hypothetical protein
VPGLGKGVHTWVQAVVAAETGWTVTFAVELVAARVLRAVVGREQAVEAIATRYVSLAQAATGVAPSNGRSDGGTYQGGQSLGRPFMSSNWARIISASLKLELACAVAKAGSRATAAITRLLRLGRAMADW